MSDLNQFIPPERHDAYVANAAHAFHEATGETVDRVIQDMGRLVAQDAEAITKAHAGEDGGQIAAEAEAFLEEPDLISEDDKNFLLAHDIASQRARDEIIVDLNAPGTSFMDMFIAAQKANNPKPPQKIDEEFAERYQAADE